MTRETMIRQNLELTLASYFRNRFTNVIWANVAKRDLQSLGFVLYESSTGTQLWRIK